MPFFFLPIEFWEIHSVQSVSFRINHLLFVTGYWHSIKIGALWWMSLLQIWPSNQSFKGWHFSFAKINKWNFLLRRQNKTDAIKNVQKLWFDEEFYFIFFFYSVPWVLFLAARDHLIVSGWSIFFSTKQTKIKHKMCQSNFMW